MTHELSPQDNSRIYNLEQDLLKIGDANIGIKESDLQSPKAQALRTHGLALLDNARMLLDGMYDEELAYAENKGNKEVQE